MVDAISFFKSINEIGNKLLEKSDIEPTKKPTQISVFNNYFETNVENQVDKFLKEIYGIDDEL